MDGFSISIFVTELSYFMIKQRQLTTILMFALVSLSNSVCGQSRQLTLSLDELFRTADKNNTSIRSFQAAVAEAEAGVKSAGAERLPDVNASLAVSYLGNGTIMDRNFTNAMSVDIPHLGTNFALQASWAVYTGGAVTSGVNLAKLNEQMARINAKDNSHRLLLATSQFEESGESVRREHHAYTDAYRPDAQTTGRGCGAAQRHHTL